MNNDKLMKIILNPASDLRAYCRIIEQRIKLIDDFVQTELLSNSLNGLVKYFNILNAIRKDNEIPLTTTATIRNLIEQTTVLNNRYSNYYSQVNSIVNIINPSLLSFIHKNSNSNIESADVFKDVDLAYISFFDTIKDDYDKDAETEVNILKNLLETNNDLRTELSDFIKTNTGEVSTDVFEAFSQLLEKYISKLSAKTISLFFGILFLIYEILNPLYQVKLSNESEERIIMKIEKSANSVKSSISDKADKEIENFNAKDSIINDKLNSINKKLDRINGTEK